MHAILEKISKGTGTMEDLERLKVIGKAMTRASLCMLGGSAANPTLSTLKHFEAEYVAHVKDRQCLAGKCKDLMSFTILKDKCIGCGMCARKCPVNAISGDKTVKFTIDQAKCIKCGECLKVCKFSAVLKK